MLNINAIMTLLKNTQYRYEKDFAEKIGLSYQGWTAIKKRGKTTNSRAKEIARALGVDVKEILTPAYYKAYS